MRRSLALVALASLAGGTPGCTNAEVRRAAALGLGCPEDDVAVRTEHQGDTAEVYEVKGCGRTGRLFCSAPDFVCTFEPAAKPAP